jgi:hypothetical protein
MRKSPDEQRLEDLEQSFQPLLIACLRECADRKRWGLFGQNTYSEAARYLRWDEASELKEMAFEIRRIRATWGDANPLAEKFLEYCEQRGTNLPGEPKRAAKFLSELAAPGA